MTSVYIIRDKDLIVGIYDDLSLFRENADLKDKVPRFPKGETNITFGKYIVEKVKMNETNIKPNQIIYKGREFNLNNLEDPMPLLDVSDPTYL